MIPKYTVEYTTQVGKHTQTNHYSTDDPITCEEFLSELLELGFGIRAVKHEGVDLHRNEFDKLVKTGTFARRSG